MPPSHIFVTAPEGRKTPINSSDGADPGNALLYVEAGTVARVRYSGDIRRSIGRGDLVLVDGDGKPAKDLEAAAAPKAWKGYDRETGVELELEKFHPERHSRMPVRPSAKTPAPDVADHRHEFTTDAMRGDRAPLFDTSEDKKEG